MTALLQISDPHFGTEQPHVVEALVRFAHEQRPEVVVLSGDITQRARRPQFAAARAFASRLGAPLLAIPGNHDIPLFNLYARLVRPYAGHVEAFGNELEPVYLSHELMVLCVNTTRPHRHKNGEVSEAQIERVAERLATAVRPQLRVVVVHQPAAVTRASDRTNLLRGHAAAVRRWAAAGADIVMGGHVHLPYVVPMTNLTRPLWVVQAGTAVSSRVRDGIPNSVNLLRWGRTAPSGLCLVERWDHDAGADAFVCRAVTDLEPRRDAASG